MKKLLAMLIVATMIVSSLGMISFAAEANTNVYNGNYSTKMVVTDSYQAAGAYFNVTADTDYVVTWMSKGSGSRLLKAQASVNYSWGTELGSGASKNGSSWQETSFEFNSGSNSLVVLVAACNSYGGAGTGYIDDVTVTKKSDGSVVKTFTFEDGKPFGGKVSDYYDVEFSEVTMANGVETDGTVTPPSSGEEGGDDTTGDDTTGDDTTGDDTTGDDTTGDDTTGDDTTGDDTTGDDTTGLNLNVRQGHYSAAVVCTSTDSFKFFTSKAIKLDADTDYVIEAWSKGSGSPSIRILNSTSWAAISTINPSGGGVWQKATGEFNSGSNTSVLYSLTNNPYGNNGTRYFDDLVLYKKGDASKTNLITDPGFELQTGWNFTKEPTIFQEVYSEEEVTIEDEVIKYIDNEVDQPNGSNSRKLYAGHKSVIFVPNGQANTLSQDVTLEANKEYRASFWVRSPEGGKMNLVIKDSSGKAIYTYEIAGTEKWVRHLPVFTSAAAGTYSYCFEAAADQTAEVYVDYAMLYLKQRVEGTKLQHLITDHSFEKDNTWTGITGSYEDGDTGVVLHVSNSGVVCDVTGGIRVMCVGDSITDGVGATNMVGGYKKALYDMYEGEGVDINFVGPKSIGEPNYDAGSGHAGYPGWRVYQIRDNIENWMTLYEPQAILLMIGTNDILQDKDDNNFAEDAINVLEETIDNIVATNSDVKLVVGSIPPLDNSSKNTKVQAYNAQIPALVAEKGENVSFVDIYSAFPSKSDGIGNDYTHPDDKGYQYIADKWFAETKDLITSLPASEFTTGEGTAYDGKWSLKYNPWFVPYYTLLTYEMFTRGTIPVETNTDYTLSMMVKGDQGVSLQTRVQTSWSGGTIATLNTNAGPAWRKASVTFNTGDYKEIILAMINSCMSTGTMYVDCIELVNNATGENILTNSSMELDADGRRTGWGTPKSPWSWVESGTEVTPPAPATVESLAVAADAKTEYYVGDEFVKPTVTATYSDGTSKTVNATFTGYDMATAGTQTVTASFGGKTTTYEITVATCPPEGDVVIETVYDETTEDGKAVVEVKLSAADNGKKTILVGTTELYYSIQREVYVGFVDESAISGTTLTGATVHNGAPTSFVYGNVDGDDEWVTIEEAVDGSDLQMFKLFVKGRKLTGAQLIAADVDGDGLADGSDLQAIKLYIKTGRIFGILK